MIKKLNETPAVLQDEYDTRLMRHEAFLSEISVSELYHLKNNYKSLLKTSYYLCECGWSLSSLTLMDL